MKDKCVLCSRETSYEFDTHIDQRLGYVEGVGQLCSSCHGYKDTTDTVEVPIAIHAELSNDMELGAYVRKLIYNAINI